MIATEAQRTQRKAFCVNQFFIIKKSNDTRSINRNMRYTHKKPLCILCLCSEKIMSLVQIQWVDSIIEDRCRYQCQVL